MMSDDDSIPALGEVLNMKADEEGGRPEPRTRVSGEWYEVEFRGGPDTGRYVNLDLTTPRALDTSLTVTWPYEHGAGGRVSVNTPSGERGAVDVQHTLNGVETNADTFRALARAAALAAQYLSEGDGDGS